MGHVLHPFQPAQQLQPGRPRCAKLCGLRRFRPTAAWLGRV